MKWAVRAHMPRISPFPYNLEKWCNTKRLLKIRIVLKDGRIHNLPLAGTPFFSKDGWWFIHVMAGIYILAISPSPRGGDFFVQIEKQGRIWRRTWKGKEEKKKRVIKHTLKYTFMKLKYRKKYTKTGKNFRGWGGRIFLAGQNIYPCW